MIVGLKQHRPMAPEPGAAGGGLDIEADPDAGEDGGLGTDNGNVDLDAAPGPDEDRGNDFKPDGAAPAPSPAPAPAPAATPAPSTAPTPAATPAPSAAPGSPYVPIGRFNEVNTRKNQLEEENAALRQRLEAASTAPSPAPSPAPTPAPAPAFDERAAERQYAELLADGEFDQAADLRVQINTHVRTSARVEFEQDLTTQQVQQTVNEASAKVVKDFPYLDTDEGVVAMTAIVAYRNKLLEQGVPAAKAIVDAAAVIAPKFAPAGSATPSRESTAPAPATDTRTAAAIARGAAQADAQPPVATGGSGFRSAAGVVDFESLTDEQWDALTPEEKKKARGDNT